MKTAIWLEALRKSVRMMDKNPSGGIENKYLQLVYRNKPKHISPIEFATMVNSESSGWSAVCEPAHTWLCSTDWLLLTSVLPKAPDYGEFNKRASDFLAALDSFRDDLQ